MAQVSSSRFQDFGEGFMNSAGRNPWDILTGKAADNRAMPDTWQAKLGSILGQMKGSYGDFSFQGPGANKKKGLEEALMKSLTAPRAVDASGARSAPTGRPVNNVPMPARISPRPSRDFTQVQRPFVPEAGMRRSF